MPSQLSQLVIESQPLSPPLLCLSEIWRVEYDETVLSENAPPFHADWDTITLEYLKIDGTTGLPEFDSRRCGGTVIWVVSQELYEDDPLLEYELVKRRFDHFEMIVFDARQYQIAIGRGDVDLLPAISDREIRRYLVRISAMIASLEIPPGGDAILIGKIIAAIAEWIGEDLDQIRFSAAPEKSMRYRFSEDVVWDVGFSDSGSAVRFWSGPCFRAWLTSPRLTRLLHGRRFPDCGVPLLS